MTHHWKLVAAAAALTASTSAFAQSAESFPSRPLRLITGFQPGGVSDTVARVTGEKLGELLGQRVIIDGRPGAGGVLSMEIAANANPDGHTLYLGQPVITISPNFKNKPPFDPLKTFAPVSLIGFGQSIMAVHPNTPASSVKELIALGKSQPPGSLRFGHSGVGSTNHLAGELFGVMSGIKMTPIAYKGAASNQLALLQGEVQISMLPVLAALPQIKAGRLKAIAVTGANRSRAVPDVPTVGETLKGYDVPVWYGFVITARTPTAIVDKLHAATQKALQTDVKDRLFSQGVETQLMSRPDFGKLIREDAVRWAKLVKEAGLSMEQ
ncbi:MAG TPA: tripartite tricarboxylate transporter substrate binding protein [Burkholderiales bacterium]|nr:tripartite tricarboxylate transporter substrate binding protein [Burkholderiales bacterium]